MPVFVMPELGWTLRSTPLGMSGLTLPSGVAERLTGSPFGRFCAVMPDQAWVEAFAAFFIRSGTNEVVHLYDPDRHGNGLDEFGNGYANTVDDAAEVKANAANQLLNCRTSRSFFSYLHYLFSSGWEHTSIPGASSLDAEQGLARVIGRALNHVFKIEFGNEGESPLELSTPMRIALNNENHPWYKLAWGRDSKIASLVSVLTQVDDPPASFVFPLNWQEAMSLTLSGADVTLALPSDQADKLRDLGSKIKELLATLDEKIDDTTDTVGTIVTVLNAVLDVLLLAGSPLSLLPATLIGLVLLGGSILVERWEQLREALEILANALTDAAEPASTTDTETTYGRLNDVLSELLSGWAWFANDLAEVLEPRDEEAAAAVADRLSGVFGVTAEELMWLWLQLRTVRPDLEEGSTLSELLSDSDKERLDDIREPIIHLSPDLFSYFFSDYATGRTTDGTGAWDPAAVPDYLPLWLEKASPTMQFARTLELASVLLEQLLMQECGHFALSRLGTGEGPLGLVARGALVDRGMSSVCELLGGVPIPRLIRFLWRQVMADGFIYQAERDLGVDKECLFEIFCWMQTEEQRALIDTVLGPVIFFEGGLNLYVRDLSQSVFASLAEAQSFDAWWYNLSAGQREQIVALIDLLDDDCYERWFPVDTNRMSADDIANVSIGGSDVDLDGPVIDGPEEPPYGSTIRPTGVLRLGPELLDMRAWTSSGRDWASWADLLAGRDWSKPRDLRVSYRPVSGTGRSALVLRGAS